MNLIKLIHQAVQSDIIPLEVLDSLLQDKSEDAKKSLLKRACQKGELIRIRNGLFVVNENDRKFSIHNFSVANFSVRPSYISLESALSHYGLIPEAVYTTTSVTPLMQKVFSTSLGVFSFSHLKLDYFNHGFYLENQGTNSFLIATPVKALIDTLVLKKKNYSSIHDLENDLRFNWDEFKSLNNFEHKKETIEMKTIYKSHRLQKFLNLLEKSL